MKFDHIAYRARMRKRLPEELANNRAEAVRLGHYLEKCEKGRGPPLDHRLVIAARKRLDDLLARTRALERRIEAYSQDYDWLHL